MGSTPKAGSLTGKLPAVNRSNMLFLFIAAFFVFLNFFTSTTILPKYVIEIGFNEFQSGLQNSLFFLTAVLLRFFFGSYIDLKGRKIPLLISSFVFATAPLFLLLSQSFAMLLVSRIYQAVGLAFFLPSASSLVADMAPASKIGAYLGLYRVVCSLGILIGPPLALLVIKEAGYDTWFVLKSLMCLVSLSMVSLIRVPVVTRCKDKVFGSLDNLKHVFSNQKVLFILSFVAIISFCYGTILTFAVTYLSAGTQIVNPAKYFIYFGMAGIAANLASGVLSDKLGRTAVAWPALMLLGLGCASLFFVTFSPVFVFISSILAGFGFSGCLLVLISWLVQVVDEGTRATTLSMQENTIDLASAIGSFLFGFVAGWIGLDGSFLITGLLVSCTALFLLFSKKYKQE